MTIELAHVPTRLAREAQDMRAALTHLEHHRTCEWCHERPSHVCSQRDGRRKALCKTCSGWGPLPSRLPVSRADAHEVLQSVLADQRGYRDNDARAARRAARRR